MVKCFTGTRQSESARRSAPVAAIVDCEGSPAVIEDGYYCLSLSDRMHYSWAGVNEFSSILYMSYFRYEELTALARYVGLWASFESKTLR